MSNYPIFAWDDNVTRPVLSGYPEMRVVSLRSAKTGAVAALHSLPRAQASLEESDRFHSSLGGQQRDAGRRDSFVIRQGVTHGCVRLEPWQLVDCFTAPRRRLSLPVGDR